MVPAFATPAVTLRIARLDNQISVFWADPNDEFDLETTGELNAEDWDTITTGITTNETTKVYVKSPSTTSTNQFFRLHRK